MRPASKTGVPAQAPKLVYTDDVLPAITADIRAVLNRLIPLLTREARRNHLRGDVFEIRRFVDPDDDGEEVFVSQQVSAATDVALDYWDNLGAALENWVDSLPHNLARTVSERMSVEVRWSGSG